MFVTTGSCDAPKTLLDLRKTQPILSYTNEDMYIY